MCLKDHVLISDFSLRLDYTIKHKEWDLDKIAFLPDKAPSLLNGLKSLGPRTSDDSCSTQSARDIVIEQRASAWKDIFAILGILSFALLAVASVYIVLTWYMLTLKTRIVHTLMPTLPEPILHLMQPPPTAPNQQPLLEPIH